MVFAFLLLFGFVYTQNQVAFLPLTPEGASITCLVEENANYAEDLLVLDGIDNLADTIEDCCDQCISNPLCNVFVYCPNAEGCGEEQQFPQLRCDLKFSAAASNKGLPMAYSRGKETTFTSGYLPDKVIAKGNPQAECPPSASAIVVFGETYPMLRSVIFENKDLDTFFTAKSNIDEIYMHGIGNNRKFCVVDIATGSIAGDLVIYADDTFPASLTALSSILSIGGDLIVIGTDNTTTLESLEGLSNLANIEGSLYIDSIPSISGLESLKSVGGSVILKSIEDLSDFPLREVVGDLVIGGTISSLAGLDIVGKVGGNVGIIGTDLVSLAGLTALTEVGGALVINNNDLLTTLEGLDSLTTLESLIISNNPVLKYLAPLPETVVGALNVHIYANGGVSRNESQVLLGIAADTPAPLDDLRPVVESLSQDVAL
eukprot:TRINITY_DN2474_c0_g1_i2.p2 TRINITY_DN2474_c0_g1~~TRINITY_DN2474_c0_g1_i2.p2  ORF type:complete len:431 (-),score=63.21 TRINITY_DN2474_c0_g1_i2:244-1536(-)